MRIVIQRVKDASVKINAEIVGEIQQGLLVFLGIEQVDLEDDADYLIQKLIHLRIFSDEEGKMILSITDISGELLIVSQFTLFASTKKGNRPSFIRSAPAEQAIPLYDYFIDQLKILNLPYDTYVNFLKYNADYLWKTQNSTGFGFRWDQIDGNSNSTTTTSALDLFNAAYHVRNLP